MDANRELPQVERRNLWARQSLVQYLEKSRSGKSCDAVETQRAAALANDSLRRFQTGHWSDLGPGRRWRGLFVVIREIRVFGRGDNFVNQRPGLMSCAKLIGLAKPLQRRFSRWQSKRGLRC